jgi:signal transduction histidine kinase/CheY-like chemotaxis protein
MVASCDAISGSSLLVVASSDFRLVFDDVDAWFIQTCASILSQTWHQRLLTEIMSAKEKFLRGFSHQLRTPIHGILGSVELLAEEIMFRKQRHVESAESISETGSRPSDPIVYLDTIKSAGRDLISIVNSMITLNKWADIAMAHRDNAIHTIYEFETELASELRKETLGDKRYRASVLFSHNPSLDSCNFRVDLSLLLHGLIPLIINAIQNTSDGVVLVTTSMRPDFQEFTVDVEDTGSGIHPDYQERIFEPYEKIDMHSVGAGLGLTLSSKFAALLRGSVVLLSSAVGRGSHFRATFRGVECTSSPLLRRPLAEKLENLPSKFYNMTPNSDDISLCDYFTRFLISHGFESSESLEDSFAIFEFQPDLKQHRSCLSQIPSGQVALCLIPASVDESCLQESSNNIVYVRGPFMTLTMSSALEEADRLASEITTLGAGLPRKDELSIATLEIDTSPLADKGRQSCICLTQQVAKRPINGVNNLQSTVPPTFASNLGPPADSRSDVSIPLPLTSLEPKALLVDDNVINLRILRMYCVKRGLPYCCATDGKQAVEIFLQHQSMAMAGEGTAFQLVLMDLQMPVCDGFEATKHIRRLEKQNKWKKSILFIVTGQDSPTDRTKAKEVGAQEYFVKPVGIKVLDRAISRHFPSFQTS